MNWLADYYKYDKYTREAIDLVEQHYGAESLKYYSLVEVQYQAGILYAKGVKLRKRCVCADLDIVST